ncbi:MAG TPA: hydrogenase 2 operon protein HybA [Patescibacteria group bacterium]|nr:hydrogenase 2 operon protein HybA [Patescibacteria group bacterium]
MPLTRRNFLKGAAAGSAVVACAATTASEAEARENKTLPPKAVGLLYDSTLCIGCKACVKACRDANDTSPEFNTADPLWDTPLDLSGSTLNVIKMYAEGTSDHKDQEKDGFAFIKKSCMHCVDPSCVSVCPVTAMRKDPDTGIVSHHPDACIGCRYCVASCPFGVPKFEYNTPTPQIHKCQMCRHRQAEGKIPACAEVCPTGATLFGSVLGLREEAARRRSLPAGETTTFSRKTVGSSDTHEKNTAHYLPHTYGETEMGGTQMMLLAGVPFDKLGYPTLPEGSFASASETIQHTVYKGMAAPVAVLGGLMYLAHKHTKHDGQDED